MRQTRPRLRALTRNNPLSLNQGATLFMEGQATTEETQPAPPYNRSETLIFVVVVVVSLVWRFLSVPSNGGGLFFQLWFSIVSLIGLALILAPKRSQGSKLFLRLVILPLVSFISVASIYFAVQALFPFMILSVLLGALWASGGETKLKVIWGSLIILPLLAYCYYGASHILMVQRLKGLDYRQVSQIEFKGMSPVERQDISVLITSPEEIKPITDALSQTTSYSPNHESIKNHWCTTITLKSGERFVFRAGKGNRAHPETAWVQFGVEVYQNPALYRALSSNPRLHL
jgi:hypothetical protein